MNFDYYYTDKKISKLTNKEKEKIIDIIFKNYNNKDKKIEMYLYENWDKIIKKYSKSVHLKYVKNSIVYIEADSKVIVQEILFLLSEINQRLKKAIGEEIKSIKEIPLHKLRKQEVIIHNIPLKDIEKKQNKKENKENSNSSYNTKLLEEIKEKLK